MPKILLIEDDYWLAQSYMRVLSSHSCQHVVDAQAAMDIVDGTLPDVILADVMLEWGTVIDLFHELQSHGDTANIPIVVCTGIGLAVRLEDMRSYGVVALLDKQSLSPAKLRSAIAEACGGS